MPFICRARLCEKCKIHFIVLPQYCLNWENSHILGLNYKETHWKRQNMTFIFLSALARLSSSPIPLLMGSFLATDEYFWTKNAQESGRDLRVGEEENDCNMCEAHVTRLISLIPFFFLHTPLSISLKWKIDNLRWMTTAWFPSKSTETQNVYSYLNHFDSLLIFSLYRYF